MIKIGKGKRYIKDTDDGEGIIAVEEKEEHKEGGIIM